MELLNTLLHTINELSPLAVIALLVVVVFLQTQNHKKVVSIQKNDLHELPEIMSTLRHISATLQRIEVSQGEHFSYLTARVNGALPRS